MPIIGDANRSLYDPELDKLIAAIRVRPLDRKIPEAAYIIYRLLLDGIGTDVNDCIIGFGILEDVKLVINHLHFGPLEQQILEARWRHGEARLTQAMVRHEEAPCICATVLPTGTCPTHGRVAL